MAQVLQVHLRFVTTQHSDCKLVGHGTTGQKDRFLFAGDRCKFLFQFFNRAPVPYLSLVMPVEADNCCSRSIYAAGSYNSPSAKNLTTGSLTGSPVAALPVPAFAFHGDKTGRKERPDSFKKFLRCVRGMMYRLVQQSTNKYLLICYWQPPLPIGYILFVSVAGAPPDRANTSSSIAWHLRCVAILSSFRIRFSKGSPVLDFSY